jgi:hypothetical protein
MIAAKRLPVLLLLLMALQPTAFAGTEDVQPSSKLLDGLTPEAPLALANDWGMKSGENKVTIWTSSRAFNS